MNKICGFLVNHGGMVCGVLGGLLGIVGGILNAKKNERIMVNTITEQLPKVVEETGKNVVVNNIEVK